MTLTGAEAAAAGAGARPYDLDGDGTQELVLGLPWWNDRGVTDAGAVAVVTGSRDRTPGRRILITQRSAGSAPEHLDAFGAGLASGDFDRDGRADLAIGAPAGGDGGVAGDPGTVTVLYGSEDLASARRDVLRGPRSTMQHDAPGFGASLAAGDLNRDGFSDLAAGTPGEAPFADADHGSGAVRILYGGPRGLTTSGSTAIARSAASQKGFGRRLALGDVDGDGHLDVLEGEPGDPLWVDEPPVPGHLSFAAGGPNGPADATAIAARMRGGADSLATGDVTGDGYADLVVGVPVDRYVGEDQDAPAGAVLIFRGGEDGPARAPIVIKQSSRGVPGSDEAGDGFGSAVAVARLDSDRFADIVVGAAGEDGSRGRVTIVRGGRRGHARAGGATIDRDTAGVSGERARGDRFGARLSILDHDGDGRSDLLAGALGQRVADAGVRAGSVTVLYGTKRGPRAAGSRVLRIAALGQPPTLDSINAGFGIGRVGGS